MSKKAKYQGGRLPDGTPLNVAVYRAYRTAGLSHNQALAITAEVGRENEFNPHVLFGTHTDPAGKKGGGKIRNVGMLSWNQGRDIQALNYLQKSGVMTNGVMHMTQENLNAQARFSVQEMRTTYRNKLQHFWSNPNADPESFARELGKNYIVWAYGQTTIRDKNGGRIPFDHQRHDNRRRGHLHRLAGTLNQPLPKYQPAQKSIPQSTMQKSVQQPYPSSLPNQRIITKNSAPVKPMGQFRSLDDFFAQRGATPQSQSQQAIGQTQPTPQPRPMGQFRSLDEFFQNLPQNIGGLGVQILDYSQ